MALFYKNKSRSRRAPHKGTLKLDASIQQSQNRKSYCGFPVQVPFESTRDALAYLNSDTIVCLRCGKSYQTLNSHLLRIHGMSVRQYKDLYKLPMTIGLAGIQFRETLRLKAIENNLAEKGKSYITAGTKGKRMKSSFKSMLAKENAIIARKAKL